MPETDPLDAIFGPDNPRPVEEDPETTEAPQEAVQAPPVADHDATQTNMDTEDFWSSAGTPEEYVGNPFMSKEEKQAAYDNRWVMSMLAVRDADTENGPTWFVDVILPSGELRTATFGNGAGLFSRDHYLTKAQEWFRSHQGGRIQFRLGKKGKTWLLEAPTD